MRRAALALLLWAIIFAQLFSGCAAPTGPGMDRISGHASFSGLPTGKLLGLTQWPHSKWGDAPLTTTLATESVQDMAPRLRLARSANLPVFVGFPRSQLTANGQTIGSFSLSAAKRAVDKYAAGPLKPDSVKKYAPYIVSWYAVDEPFCDHCWGGVAAKYADLVAYLKYFRAKIDPGHLVPLAIRVAPSKLEDEGGDWDGTIDVAWTVYRAQGRFSPKEQMDREWAIAQRHGWQMVGAVNAEDCRGTNTAPCTATELLEYLEPIIRHPGVCASTSWKYADWTWNKQSIRRAWAHLSDVARSQPTRRCV